jgi:uncharacterized protein
MTAGDLAVWTIRGYQHLISRHMPPMCRFYPSCSAYGLQAVQLHGLGRGGAMAAWRVLRCNPFHPGGHDPVPPPPGRLSGGAASGAPDEPDAPDGPGSRAGGHGG